MANSHHCHFPCLATILLHVVLYSIEDPTVIMLRNMREAVLKEDVSCEVFTK